MKRPYLLAAELYEEFGSYRQVAEELTEQGCACSHETARTWVRVGREARRLADEREIPRTNELLAYYATVIVDEAVQLVRCAACRQLKLPSQFRKRLVKRGAAGYGRLASVCLTCRGVSS